jgi:micrococcal nuclease
MHIVPTGLSRRICLPAIALAVLSACAGSAPPRALYRPGPTVAPTSGVFLERATVVKVIDADTIQMQLSGGRDMHVQLIGVDAPDGGEPWRGRANKLVVDTLKRGRTVYLEEGPLYWDNRKRHLAYLWLSNPATAGARQAPTYMLNAILLSSGYARIEPRTSNPKYGALFRSLELAAKRGERGIWG